MAFLCRLLSSLTESLKPTFSDLGVRTLHCARRSLGYNLYRCTLRNHFIPPFPLLSMTLYQKQTNCKD